MLIKVNEITGYVLDTQDGEFGRCHDFLFDDHAWTIRYAVVKTAKWLPGHKVLISPVYLGNPDWVNQSIPVDLTRRQIEESPPLEEHAPVSRQYEIDYHQYYELPFYWVSQNIWQARPDSSGVVHPVLEPELPDLDEIEAQEGHLRSTEEVKGYSIIASDGVVGHVDDFVIDDINWVVRYLVLDTRNWLPGRKILISPDWIESVHWVDRDVHLNIDSEVIKNSPEFDASQPINRKYEVKLYDFYGRPHYWS